MKTELQGLTGCAAILRFPLHDIEDFVQAAAQEQQQLSTSTQPAAAPADDD